MKKSLAILLIFSLIMVAGCGQKESSQNEGRNKEITPTAADKVVLKLGHALPVNHTVDLAAKRFAEIVEEKSQGNIEIQVFPAAQLGNEKDMLEQISLGSQDMGVIVAGAYGAILPELQIGSLVYVFRDIAHAEKVMRGEIGKEMTDKLLNDRSVRVIDPYWYYGTRHLTANKQVKNPDDLKGMKIRVPEVAIQKDGLTAMGAAATPVDFNELYTALSTGVVDGQENPVTTTNASAFYEVQDYLMLTGHIISNFMVSISDSVYEKLSTEQQQILIESAEEAGKYNNQITVEAEEKEIEELVQKGMTVIEPENEKFMPAGEIVAEKYEDIWGDLYYRIQDVK